MQRLLTGLLVLFLVISVARVVHAQVAVDQNDVLINLSDLIVVATVTGDTRETTGNGVEVGRATLQVDAVLKGPKLDKLTITYAAPPKPQPGAVAGNMGAHITLTPKDQRLFFLQRNRDGYRVIDIYFGDIPGGVQRVEQAANVAAALKAVTVELSFAGPVGPFYFGQPVPVAVKIKNTGKAAISFGNPTLVGYFFSPRMDAVITFQSPVADGPRLQPLELGAPVVNDVIAPQPILGKPEAVAPKRVPMEKVPVELDMNAVQDVAVEAQPVKMAQGIADRIDGPGVAEAQAVPVAPKGRFLGASAFTTLKPGEETVVKFPMICQKPASWALLTSEMSLLTVINVHATLSVQIPLENDARRQAIVATPWVDALAGFPLPQDAMDLLQPKTTK